MPKVDYIWIVLGILAVILIIAWGPMSRWFRAVSYTHLTLPTNREV